MKNEKTYVNLWDYDSMIYKCVYKIASIKEIKKWFKAGKSKDWMTKEIVNLSLNRLANMCCCHCAVPPSLEPCASAATAKDPSVRATRAASLMCVPTAGTAVP